MERKSSLGSFILGLVLGMILTIMLLAFVGVFAVQQFSSGAWRLDGSFLAGTDFRESIVRMIGEQQGNIFLYGKFVSSTANMLMLEAETSEGVKTYTFLFDGRTQFLASGYANGVAIETPYAPGELTVGEYITVYAAEPIGTVEDQYAVKVTRQ
jgi:hypothetical protein